MKFPPSPVSVLLSCSTWLSDSLNPTTLTWGEGRGPVMTLLGQFLKFLDWSQLFKWGIVGKVML